MTRVPDSSDDPTLGLYLVIPERSDHPFRDSAGYVTETAGTNRPSHSPVTRFTAKCDFGLSENFE